MLIEPGSVSLRPWGALIRGDLARERPVNKNSGVTNFLINYCPGLFSNVRGGHDQLVQTTTKQLEKEIK